MVWSTPLAAQRSERRVITPSDIAAAGWHRLGDLAAALPPGTTASVDGFNHELSGSRLGFVEAGGSRAAWLVRLDGQLMPVSIGGLWILDAIPVSLLQLDSVVIHDGPRIVDGRTATLGTIELFTRRPRRGATLTADYQHGDETGDPGPYRYTARATPNVEKLGPFAAGVGSLASDRIGVDLAARYSSLNITDARLARNLSPAVPLQTDVNASGGSGIATIQAAGGMHFVIAGRGRFTGLMRVPEIAAFQQARIVSSHAGASGSFSLAGKEWRYTASATELDGQRLNDPFPMQIAQARRTGTAFVEAPLGGAVRAGIGGTHGEIESDSATTERDEGRAWVAYAGATGEAAVSATRENGSHRLSVAARHERRLDNGDVVALSITALRAHHDPGVIDVRGEITTGWLSGLQPTWYTRAFSVSGGGLADPVNGLAAGFIARTLPGRRVGAWIRGEASHLLGTPSTGESSTPAGFAEGNVSAALAGNFVMSISGRFSPATRWHGIVTNHDRSVAATQRLVLTVNKTMWRERLRAQLVFRNLLDTDEWTHPLGAQWSRRTHLAVTFALPGGTGR